MRMSEASSSPLSRSPTKPLEYTSCIDTHLLSSSPNHRTAALSAYDMTGRHPQFDSPHQTSRERRQSKELNNDNHPHRHALERDLRRLDIDCNSHILAMNNKPLNRTESISLPTTPIEQMSSTFHQKRHRLFIEHRKNPDNSNEQDDQDDDAGADNDDDKVDDDAGADNDDDKVDDDDDDDDEDDEDNVDDDEPMSMGLTSPTDDITALSEREMQQLMRDEAMSNSKSNLQSSSSSSSSTESNIPNLYGVDWSDNAYPTSHCWFPYKSSDPSSSQMCSFFSCKNPKPTLQLSLLQCESCLIVVHTHHLTDLQSTSNSLMHMMPPCRPSFSDVIHSDDQFDQHFWTQVPLLSKHCAFCKRKSLSSSLFSYNRASTMPIMDLINQGNRYRSPIPGSPKTSGGSSGLQCLWCSRGYHRRCWEQIYHQDDKNKCDYGLFRHIIVRPQWIHRVSGTPNTFRAQYRSNENEDSRYTPLLLFINKRSGGQSGEKIYRKLLRLLNPRQVFLLENDRTIIHALDIYGSLPNIRICVFGGDGTVGWILGRLAESYSSLDNPPVSICPLGTGNDLSRVLSWGEQYDPKRLLPTLVQIPDAQPIALDRWQVTIEPVDLAKIDLNSSTGRTFLSMLPHPKFIRDTQRPSYQNHRTLPNSRFINYMSFGLDAAIALEFHDRRSKNPAKFSSPLKNKLMYLNESRKYLNDFARSRLWNLSSYIRLICDGENLTHLIQNCHTLLVLNIPGYASGTNPWGKTSTNSSSQSSSIQKDSDSFEQISTSSVELADIPANTHEVYELITLNECSTDSNSPTARTTVMTFPGRFERQDFGDKKIEVVGLSTTHMATIHIGFRGIRIAQCNQLRIELCCPMTAQMDGEPFYLPESVAVNITHAGQVLVLRNENR